MPRELSAGGVVVRQSPGALEFAVIRPQGRNVWALPKGHVDPGETPEQAAEREVNEETGLSVRLLAHLGDIHYVYQFRGRRIFKEVSFFLFRYVGGEVGQISPQMRAEVDEARWAPLAEAGSVLTYPGEKKMAQKALEQLSGQSSGETLGTLSSPEPRPPRR